MVTTDHEDLDRIINELEPDHIPAEFVSAARITDFQGNSYVVTAEELEDIMLDDDTLEDQGIAQIRLIVNFEDVKASIVKYSGIILSSIAF